jgi:hypothetical protein
MPKKLKNKDETITIRVEKSTKDKAVALYEKTGTTATLASFLGDMVILGMQVKEITQKQQDSAIQAMANAETRQE